MSTVFEEICVRCQKPFGHHNLHDVPQKTEVTIRLVDDLLRSGVNFPAHNRHIKYENGKPPLNQQAGVIPNKCKGFIFPKLIEKDSGPKQAKPNLTPHGEFEYKMRILSKGKNRIQAQMGRTTFTFYKNTGSMFTERMVNNKLECNILEEDDKDYDHLKELILAA